MKSLRLIIWLGVALAITACSNSATDAPEPVVIETIEIVPGLSMRLLREGTGAVAEVGHIAVVHYTGWLYDQTAESNRGDKFDSSVDRGVHFVFPLGGRRVIRGWDEGVTCS